MSGHTPGYEVLPHRGFVAPNRKMSVRAVAAARFVHVYAGVSIRFLAAKYGVSYSSMRAAVNGNTYV